MPRARSARDIVDYYLARVGLAGRPRRSARPSSRTACASAWGIARAFALSPKLLLLDEPFGMLDSLTRWELQELLMEVWTQDTRHGDLRHARRRRGDPAGRSRRDDDERPAREDRPDHARRSAATADSRKALLEHPDYYAYRQEILTFLAGCEHAGRRCSRGHRPHDGDRFANQGGSNRAQARVTLVELACLAAAGARRGRVRRRDARAGVWRVGLHRRLAGCATSPSIRAASRRRPTRSRAGCGSGFQTAPLAKTRLLAGRRLDRRRRRRLQQHDERQDAVSRSWPIPPTSRR